MKKILKKNIINAFSYTLKDTPLDWCHNYMSEFLDYILLKLKRAFCKRHWKTQNDEQILWAVPTQPCAVVSIFKNYIRVIWVG
jgi:hypothetical protein